MNHPLVSVICLCYNHERFVEEAVQSVLHQTYPNIELWVVDDASTDSSREVIGRLKEKHPHIRVLLNTVNRGHCRSFNAAFWQSHGEFIIDLAADDVLMPDRISKGVDDLTKAGPEYAVHFGDALYINEEGSELGRHSRRYPHASVPDGDIYKEIISRYFICPPTVMFRRKVLEALGGYDENLHYEDFDVLVRAARQFYFRYSPDMLVKRRLTANARSRAQFRLFSRHSLTTLAVCRKIMAMNRTEAERLALQHRLWYEMKLNLRLMNLDVFLQFLKLYLKNKSGQ